MSGTTQNAASPLGQALGRVPSGLFILTVRHEGRATGMLASWVMQAGFDPPMLTVALGVGRYVGDWVAASGGFTLNQVPESNKTLIRHFGRGFDPKAEAFNGLTVLKKGRVGPVLAGALSYLDAEVACEMAVGDHRVFLARVVGGEVIDEAGEPKVHLRKNGFHY